MGTPLAPLAELLRLLTRRAVALLLLAAVLFTALVAARTIWDTRSPTADELATAQAQAQLAADEPEVEERVAQCRRDPESFLGADAEAADCRTALVPDAADLLPRERLHPEDLLEDTGPQVAVVLTGLLVVAGATYAGADWRSGAIATRLALTPGRARVWLGKAVAVLLAAGLVGVVLLGGFWAAVWGAAEVRGLDVADATWTQVGWQAGRGVVLAMGAALGAFALAMLFRSTVATLALLFAYAAGGEVLVNLVPVEGAARWTAGANLGGWLERGFSYADPGVGCQPFSACDATRTLGHLDAAWFLGALLLIALVASVLVFLRRDV